ncbi:MAG: type II secretion system protein [Lachnospiraceae bacterium]|nr:type II secretion system GspH family protein [Lachnospiraceae bacterium]MDD7378304.1 type II secretion system protein [Lachnospiraceae bacterium]MDY4617620.1 type II secretion system protein [Lachnospiraceae bacterium]
MKQDNRGATLIEILVAMAILAICALPLFKSLILSAQTNVKAREHLSATTAAEAVIEEMKADGMEKFLRENQGNEDITDVEKITEAGAVTGYRFTYPDYEVDGKGYEVKVEVRPYRNTDEGAEDYNSKEISDLYRMDLRTDGIYVQDEKTMANDFVKLVSEGVFEAEQRETVLSGLDMEWKYTIGSSNDVQTIDQNVTYSYNETLVGEHESILYDGSHADGKLKNLYICFIPNKSNTITIVNKEDYPLTVYLIKQGTSKAKVKINIIGNTPITQLGEKEDADFNKGVRIRTNLTSEDEAEYHYIRGSSDTKLTAGQLQENFGLKELDGAKVQTRLYDIDITVSRNGKEITTLSGTASR